MPTDRKTRAAMDKVKAHHDVTGGERGPEAGTRALLIRKVSQAIRANSINHYYLTMYLRVVYTFALSGPTMGAHTLQPESLVSSGAS